MTIAEAIKKALTLVDTPLTYKEIYKKIIELDLYEFGAKRPEGVVHAKIRKHCVGLDFPSASPVKYFEIVSQDGRLVKYGLKRSENIKLFSKRNLIAASNERIPEEKIQDAYIEHRENVKQMLLEEIIKSDPAFFERLVVDVLLSMGYGGDFSGAGLVTSRSADEGIDGIIKEDKLGLDKIYIQAKR